MTDGRSLNSHETYAVAVYEEVAQSKVPCRARLSEVTDEATYNHTVVPRQVSVDST